MRWKGSALLLGVALTLLAVTGLGRQGGGSEAAATPEITAVRTAAVELRDQRDVLRAFGVLRSRQRASLSFLVPGRLALRRFEVGQEVRRGEVLARLDNPELTGALRVAEARVAESEVLLAEADQEVVRVERLVRSKAAPDEELRQARHRADARRSAREVARAGLQDAEERLAEATLRSPFDGTVVAAGAELGEFVAPGQPILTLAGSGDFEVEIEVPESRVRRVVIGRPVTVRMGADGSRQTPGEVRAVGSGGRGAGNLFPAILRVEPAPWVASGIAVDVELDLGSEPALLVPVEAILNPGGALPSVFRVRQGRAERVPVDTESLVGDRVVVRGELRSGDQVVTLGQEQLTDGQAVEVLAP